MATSGDFSSINKVDKTPTPNVVYLTDALGATTQLGWDLLANPITVPVRDANGAVQVGNPVGNFDAVNKFYFDVAVIQFLVAVARAPHTIWHGAITLDAFGAPISAAVIWPMSVTGLYTGVASATFPGSIDSWTITHDASGATFVQAAVTRDGAGNVIFQPAITIV